MFSFVGASLHVHDTGDDSTAKNAPAFFIIPALSPFPISANLGISGRAHSSPARCTCGMDTEVHRAFHFHVPDTILNFADRCAQSVYIRREVLPVEGGKGLNMANDVIHLGLPARELGTHSVTEYFHVHRTHPLAQQSETCTL